MAHLNLLKAGVFFLQETHLCPSEVNQIKRVQIGDVFHSKFPVRARGAAVLKIKSVPGEVISDPIEINKIFSAFYTDLYSSQCPLDIWVGETLFFNRIAFPKINGDLCRELGSPVTIKEVQDVIMTLQTQMDSLFSFLSCFSPTLYQP